MNSELQRAIQEKYGAIARSAGTSGCCDTACACGDPISSNLYSEEEQRQLPLEAVAASLGCGNPTALVELEPGQTVLDLGSGGGIDVLLSARRVGPSGKAYGLDMTDDKDAALREAFRVLKPGGRLAVSDVVSRGPVPEDIRRNTELWTGCIAGALDQDDYIARLQRAGFADVSLEPWREYDRQFASAFIRARKPEAACCGPSCCCCDAAAAPPATPRRGPGDRRSEELV